MNRDQRLFEGSIVALVTPMKESGEIDYQCLNKLIEWHIKAGTKALVIMGTTGESSIVLESELLRVVAAAIEYSNSRISIIAGCGLASTSKSVNLAKELCKLSPAALLTVTPYYVKAMQNGLYRHFSEIADCSDCPVILYNVPSRTASDLHEDTIVKLANHNNIIGIKDATADVKRVKPLLERVETEFCILSGDDETAFEFVNAGGHGVISVTGNIVPEKMAQWTELFASGNKEDAEEVFNQIMPLHKALFVESNPIPVKWALSVMDKIESGIRLPMTLPSTQSQQMIKKAMQQCGVV